MIYVLSDIHGHRRRYDSIMKQINLQPDDTLYVLGDVIDRNPYGIQILREIMAMPNAVMLLGNHEHMMLEAIYRPFKGDPDREEIVMDGKLNLWYRNGGGVTHQYLKHIRKTIRQEIFKYLDNLPVNLEVTVNGITYLLTHAAAKEDYYRSNMKYKNENEFAVWYRYRGFERGIEGRTIIFGHTGTFEYQDTNPTEIWRGTNMIGIDCGGAYNKEDYMHHYLPYTRLACIRLDDMKVFYSEEVPVSDPKKGAAEDDEVSV